MPSSKVEKLGIQLADFAHTLILFLISAAVLWSAGFEVVRVFSHGYPKLDDILLLFIYLELVAMVGIYFRTKRLPVRFLIYIAITALTRYLAVDMKEFDLWMILALSGSILVLSAAVFILRYTSAKYRIDEPQ